MKITIENIEKGTSVHLYDDKEFLKKYGTWASTDVPTMIKAVQDNYDYLLWGYEGYGIQPEWQDIRNTRIDTHGEQRVSGTSKPLFLDFIIQPLLIDYLSTGGIQLYDHLIETLTSKHYPIKVIFDTGYRQIYQLYSFQSQDTAYAPFKLLGASGGNGYWLLNDVTSITTIEQPNQFMFPTMLNNVLNHSKTENYISNKHIEKEIELISTNQSPFEIYIRPKEDSYPHSFMRDVELSLLGNTIKIKGEITGITIEKGGKITVSSNGGHTIEGSFPPTVNMGLIRLIMKIREIRGDFECEWNLTDVIVHN